MDNIKQTEIRRWYAYYTKPKHEFKAAEQLKSIGIDFFLPSITEKKKWSDRWKIVTEPLFRGYIFVNVNEKERLLGLQQKAIINTVSFSGQPFPFGVNLFSGLHHNADVTAFAHR